MNARFPTPCSLTPDMLETLCLRMGLHHAVSMPDIPLAGSPERSRDRMVIRTDQGCFVLEAFSPDQISHKQAMASILFHLHDLGLQPLLLPLKTAENHLLLKQNGFFFQITPYRPGEDLPRPAWVQDAWRGKAFATVILDLLEKRKAMDAFLAGKPKTFFARQPFNILAYISTLMHTLKTNNPTLYRELLPVQIWTEAILSPRLADIPVAFCHGDLHPMNVLWGKKEITHVIDWEFCGIKPEIHDLANLLGCLGSEDPMALQDALAETLLTSLVDARKISPEGWEALVPMVVAIRFCWLSEWLRKEDLSMIALESHYLRLLVSHSQDLHRLWHSLF